jgi:hypothetical protein
VNPFVDALKRAKRAKKAAPRAPEAPPQPDEHVKRTKADVLLELVLKEGIELFHNLDKDAFADVKVTVDDRECRATYRVGSSDFARWLVGVNLKGTGKGATASTIRDVQATLDAKAVHDGPVQEVHVRVAPSARGDVAYLDLGDETYKTVAISARGWKLVADCPARFTRPRGLWPLPQPNREYGLDGVKHLDSLWKYANVRQEDRPLVLAWLLAALRPHGPYPVLVLRGEQGSAKSCTARFLAQLIDPKRVPLGSLFRDEESLFIHAQDSQVIVYDNISTLAEWQSNLICQVATGGGLCRRKLYTNSEQVFLSACRPVILAGIEDFAVRNDLRERALILDLPRIPDERRKGDRDVKESFGCNASRFLGMLLDAAVLTKRHEPDVRPDCMPRLADFYRLGLAAEQALGWEKDSFKRAWDRNVDETNGGVLDNEPIVAPLQKLLAEVGAKGWEGSATELLGELARVAGYGPDKPAPRSWPAGGRQMGDLLRRLAPNLRSIGIDAQPSRSRKEGRVWKLVSTPKSTGSRETSSPSSPSSPDRENTGRQGGRMVEDFVPENPFDSSPGDEGDEVRRDSSP